MNTILNLQQEFSTQRSVMSDKVNELKSMSLLDRIASRGVCEQYYVSPLLRHYHPDQVKRQRRQYKGDKYKALLPEYKRAFSEIGR